MSSQSSFLLFSSNTTTVTAKHSFPTKPPSKLFPGMCFLSTADSYLYRYVSIIVYKIHSWNIYATCYRYMFILLSKLYDCCICFTSMCHFLICSIALDQRHLHFPQIVEFPLIRSLCFSKFSEYVQLDSYWVLMFYKQRKWVVYTASRWFITVKFLNKICCSEELFKF